MIFFLISSCSTLSVRDYTPQLNLTKAMDEANITVSQVIVSPRSQLTDEILKSTDFLCGDIKLKLPANKTIKAYISDAIQSELVSANKYDSQGKPIHLGLSELSLKSVE